MGTSDYPISTSRRYAHAQIALWLENLIDLEKLVDDHRADLDRVLKALLRATSERDRTLRRLAQLLENYEQRCATLKVSKVFDTVRP